MKECNYRRAWL